METFLPTKPASNKLILKRSIKLYAASFSKFILPALLLAICLTIPHVIYNVFQGNPAIITFSWERLWLLLANLVSMVFFIAILWHIFCVMRGVHEPFIEDVVVGFKKVLIVFVAFLIVNLIILAVSIVLYMLQRELNQYHVLFIENSWLSMSFTIALLIGMLVLLFYISTLFIFSMPLIAIENKGIFKSLQQSAALTWNHWWRTFSLQVTPFIVCIIVAAIIQIITKIPINFDFTIDQSLLISSSILRIVLYTVFVPWFACTLLLQLKDLELRKSLAQQRKTK